MSELSPTDYSGLRVEVEECIRTVQYAAPCAVNRELIGLYGDIGRLIVERQAEDSWSEAVVETLAQDLPAEFPGLQGFSARNIRRRCDFYRTYRDKEEPSPLVAEIGWSHTLVVLTTCKADREHERELQGELPGPEAVARLLEGVGE